MFQEIETVTNVVGPLDKQPEEDEEVYYKRIFKKKPEDSDTEFEKRVTVIRKTHPELKVWKNDVYKKYVTIVEVTKEQPTTETDVTETTKKTVTRSVTQPESPETTEVYYVILIRTLACIYCRAYIFMNNKFHNLFLLSVI